ARRWESCSALVAALESAGAGSGPEPAAPPPPAPAAEALQTRFGTTLAADVIRARLEGFRRQWNGKVVSAGADAFAFRLRTPRSFWQRWTGRQPGLDVYVALGRAPAGAPGGTEVRVTIRPRECGPGRSAELLKVVAPLLVESVRGYLEVNPRGRRQERL